MRGSRNIFRGWGTRDNLVFLRGSRSTFKNFTISIEFNKFEFFKRGPNLPHSLLINDVSTGPSPSQTFAIYAMLGIVELHVN